MDFNWNPIWQGKSPGQITCFSQDNRFFGVSGKNTYVFEFDERENTCSELFSTKSEKDFTISDINLVENFLVCSVTTYDKSSISYCIYKNIHEGKNWNRTLELPGQSNIKGIIYWSDELQIVSSEQSLFSRNGLYGGWNEIYRFNFPTDWFQKICLPSGDILLLVRNELYCLKGTKFNLLKLKRTE